jgi:glucokinase
MTNLGWDISAESVKKYVLDDKVSIINDFVANGYGILELEEKDIITLNYVPKR